MWHDFVYVYSMICICSICSYVYSYWDCLWCTLRDRNLERFIDSSKGMHTSRKVTPMCATNESVQEPEPFWSKTLVIENTAQDIGHSKTMRILYIATSNNGDKSHDIGSWHMQLRYVWIASNMIVVRKEVVLTGIHILGQWGRGVGTWRWRWRN